MQKGRGFESHHPLFPVSDIWPIPAAGRSKDSCAKPDAFVVGGTLDSPRTALRVTGGPAVGKLIVVDDEVRLGQL